MSAYPRLNRAALRAAVRELTAIHSTDIVSDARINDLLNERLYRITRSCDNLYLFWRDSGGSVPVTIVDAIAGKTYRFPGWRWDNTTQFPTVISADLYLESDSDNAPWDDGSNDMALVYGVAADVLAMINDDSGRAATYTTKFTEMANNIIRDDFINHNMYLAGGGISNTTIPSYQPLSLAVLAFSYIQDVVSVDSDLSSAATLVTDIYQEYSVLSNAFAWPGLTGQFNYFSPHVDILAYGAAAKLAKRLGVEQSKIDGLLEQYNVRKDSLLRQKLYQYSGVVNSTLIGQSLSQVRALLQDFSNDLPDNLIYSWLNIAYQTLAQERAWPWLEGTANFSFPAGVSSVDLSVVDVSNRILNVFEVRYNGAGEVIDSEIVYPVPHILDGKVGDARYTYDISGGFLVVSPTPTEEIYLRVRYIMDTLPIVNSATPIYFDYRFADILAYRAAVIGSSWSDYGKKMRDVFQDTADKLFDGMVSYYMLDHSTEPMQLGGSALETKKYLPWFRTP